MPRKRGTQPKRRTTKTTRRRVSAAKTGGSKTTAKVGGSKKTTAKKTTAKKSGLAFDLRNAKNRETVKNESAAARAKKNGRSSTPKPKIPAKQFVVTRLEEALKHAKKGEFREVRQKIDSARRVAMQEYQGA